MQVTSVLLNLHSSYICMFLSFLHNVHLLEYVCMYVVYTVDVVDTLIIFIHRRIGLIDESLYSLR